MDNSPVRRYWLVVGRLPDGPALPGPALGNFGGDFLAETSNVSQRTLSLDLNAAGARDPEGWLPPGGTRFCATGGIVVIL